ncbi:TIGR03936 family radical SAM-associated protein [Candidatus Auribacterota bacterium]
MITDKLYKIRIKYSILGPLKFISHRDTMRLLFRLFRQVKLPFKFSEGFSPHPISSFGPPRPVGIESSHELIDVSLEEKIKLIETKDKLNQIVPKGLKFMSIKKIKEKDFRLKELSQAVYCIKLPKTLFLAQKDINAFLSAEKIVITKKKKDKIKTVDIKSFIYALNIEKNQLSMTLKIGENNVPVFALLEKLFPEYHAILGLTVRRKKLKRL